MGQTVGVVIKDIDHCMLALAHARGYLCPETVNQERRQYELLETYFLYSISPEDLGRREYGLWFTIKLVVYKVAEFVMSFFGYSCEQRILEEIANAYTRLYKNERCIEWETPNEPTLHEAAYRVAHELLLNWTQLFHGNIELLSPSLHDARRQLALQIAGRRDESIDQFTFFFNALRERDKKLQGIAKKATSILDDHWHEMMNQKAEVDVAGQVGDDNMALAPQVGKQKFMNFLQNHQNLPRLLETNDSAEAFANRVLYRHVSDLIVSSLHAKFPPSQFNALVDSTVLVVINDYLDGLLSRDESRGASEMILQRFKTEFLIERAKIDAVTEALKAEDPVNSIRNSLSNNDIIPEEELDEICSEAEMDYFRKYQATENQVHMLVRSCAHRLDQNLSEAKNIYCTQALDDEKADYAKQVQLMKSL